MQGIYHEHSNLSNWPAYEILALIAYAQRPRLNTRADVASGARRLNLGMSLNLHPYFVYASGEGPDETAHMRRLV